VSTKRPRGVLAQVKAASANPWSAILGALVGGIVPFAAYTLAHRAQSSGALTWVRWSLVLACLAFSAPTVYEWARQAFGTRRSDVLKSVGFVVLLEGVLLGAGHMGVGWLGVASLCYLVGINAVAVACRFAGAGS
jgi:hypothetical protein